MAVPIVAVGDHLKVRIACQLGTQFGLNVLGYRVAATVGASTDLLTIAQQMYNVFSVAYFPWLTNNANFYGTAVSRYTPGIPTDEYTQVLVAGGAAGPNAQPSQAAGLIRLLTGIAGRSFRGRVYIPFADGSNIDGATSGLNAAGTVVLNNLSTALFVLPVFGVGANLASLALEIVHRARPGPPPVGRTFSDVNAVAIRTFLATQRRRSELNRPDAVPFV